MAALPQTAINYLLSLFKLKVKRISYLSVNLI